MVTEAECGSEGFNSSIFMSVIAILLIFLPAAVPATASFSQIETVDEEGWWMHWSRDSDRDRVDDYLEYAIAGNGERLREMGLSDFRIFIDLDHKPVDSDITRLEEIGGEIGLSRLKPYPLADTVAASLLVPIGEGVELRVALNKILNVEGVVMIEAVPDVELHLAESNEWHGTTALRRDSGLTGQGVTVAVVDTGVDCTHKGLDDLDDDPITTDPKVVAYYDAIDNPTLRNGTAECVDTSEHGSHVAGIVSGTGAPDTEYIGVAPGARIVGVRACCGDPLPFEGDDVELVLSGLEWVVEKKDVYDIRIVTMSLGEQYLDDFVADNDGNSAWSRANDALVMEHDLVVTCSQGNEGRPYAQRNTVDVPADAFHVIAVGSLDKDGGLAEYSSRGTTSDGRVKPEVSAIGSDVMSVDANSGDGYTAKSGTSMATPFVAGYIALLLEARPELSGEEVRLLLMDTADQAIWASTNPIDGRVSPYPEDYETPNNDFGWGRIQPMVSLTTSTLEVATFDPSLVVYPPQLSDGTVARIGSRLNITLDDTVRGRVNAESGEFEWTIHRDDEWGGNSTEEWAQANDPHTGQSAALMNDGLWEITPLADWRGQEVSIQMRVVLKNGSVGPGGWIHLSVANTSASSEEALDIWLFAGIAIGVLGAAFVLLILFRLRSKKSMKPVCEPKSQIMEEMSPIEPELSQENSMSAELLSDTDDGQQSSEL